MIKEEREIILNLSYQELVEKFKEKPQRIIDLLQKEDNIDEHSDYIIEKLITLIIIIVENFYIEDDSFNKFLCKLATDKKHHNHEDLAWLFERKHSPKLINCVYELAIMELDYMDYDEDFNIARKCTYALGFTNTPKAKEKLELLAKNKNELIRDYAIKQLKRHDFNDEDIEEQY